MQRTEWLQKTQRMRFKEAMKVVEVVISRVYKRLCCLVVCDLTFRRDIVKYDEGGLEARWWISYLLKIRIVARQLMKRLSQSGNVAVGILVGMPSTFMHGIARMVAILGQQYPAIPPKRLSKLLIQK